MSEPKKSRLPATVPPPDATGRISEAIIDFVANVPKSSHRKHKRPAEAAAAIASAAASKAAVTAGSLALPPGPLGWLTILPELVAVWKIQSQMVADIAAVYGKKPTLTREQMIYCLFRHTAAQAVRDMVVRIGERILVRRAPQAVLQGIAGRIATKLAERVLGKGVTRWLPVVGALGVGAYAYIDTGQVAKTAIELFEREIDLDPTMVIDAD